MRHLIQKHSGDPLLLLRALACLLVIGGHVQRPELRARHLLESFNWLGVSNGHFGVWIFFILSGYLIGKGFLSGRYTWSVKGVTDYYLRRCAKVYIPYVIAALIVLLLYRVDLSRCIGIMRDVLLIRGNQVYGVSELSYLWTISSIVLWYLIAPVVCRLFLFFKDKKQATLLLGAGIIVAGEMLRYLYTVWYPSETFPAFNAQVYIHFLPNLYFFLIGVWLNLITLPHPNPLLPGDGIKSLLLKGEGQDEVIVRQLRNQYSSIVGLLIAYLVSTYYLSAVYAGYPWSFVPYATVAPLLTLLAVCWFLLVVEKKQRVKKEAVSFGNVFLMPLAVTGLYSYELYLMQTPIIRLLKLECGSGWCPLWLVFFRAVLVTLLALGISLSVLRLRRRLSVPSE